MTQKVTDKTDIAVEKIKKGTKWNGIFYGTTGPVYIFLDGKKYFVKKEAIQAAKSELAGGPKKESGSGYRDAVRYIDRIDRDETRNMKF